jgi:hypothetical protein
MIRDCFSPLFSSFAMTNGCWRREIREKEIVATSGF